MLNPFFQQGSRSEQGLIQDLINEQLRMYGVEVHYLPRKYITELKIIREVIESVFDSAYPIEAYVNNYDGYDDNPTILSKFGIQALNEITLTISRERFETYISPLIRDQDNIRLSFRPKEGDLIYFPLGDRLFEIKYVEHEKPFYQLQKNYTYELRCELFRYEDEVIDTGIQDIDDNLVGIGISDNSTISLGAVQTLVLAGIGSTAYATASIVNGGIRYITVTNRGGGYINSPQVAISSAPSGGKTGIATASMIGGVVACNDNISPNAKSVQSVLLVNPGYGYTITPKVRFIGGGGSGATATATIGNGIVGVISMTSVGSGYTSSPTITFTGISSVSASAVAVVDNNGRITSINLTNTGLGYTQPPTITISTPYMSGIGTYMFNEVITGSLSGSTARVRTWNAVTKTLEVSNVTGSFMSGESIVGSASSASYMLKILKTEIAKDGYGENDDIEIEADKIIDFSQVNPFGTP
ncbi:MAG: Synechococcus phage [Bacteroidota bacterium]